MQWRGRKSIKKIKEEIEESGWKKFKRVEEREILWSQKKSGTRSETGKKRLTKPLK